MVGALVTTNVAVAGSRDAGLRNAEATVTDVSARKRRHRGNNAAAAAMFGMVAGTIASIAAAQAHRDRVRRYHYHHGYHPHYGYRPHYGYQAYAWEGPRYYHAPTAPYAPGYYRHW